METGTCRPSFQRLMSDESVTSAGSSDSCEYYQTEIFSLLPSSQAQRHQQVTEDHTRPAPVSWNPSVPLRALPLCLQERRNIRERQHLQRGTIGSWDSWMRSQRITGRRVMEQAGRFMVGLLPWRQTLHSIEGRFGVGVKSYFLFLRYLLCLNLLYCAVIGGSVLTPALLFRKSGSLGFLTDNISYKDVFVGSGFLENSLVFYGFYTRGSLDRDCLNTPLLFLMGMVSILVISAVLLVRRTVVGYKHSWLAGGRVVSSNTLSNKVFCGWDFCIQNPEAASLKRSFNRNELKMDLEEQTFNDRVRRRSFSQRVQLILLRVLLNFLVLVLLVGSFVLIYYSIGLSQSQDRLLILEYLPAITMTTVNFVLPRVFSHISQFEDYSPATQLNFTLIRSIVLKLASLGLYLFFFINALKPSTAQKCVENELGKEMYKLTVFSLLQCLFGAFCVSYPRRLLVERWPCSWLARVVGTQLFEIPLNVLDLVTGQTVTWVGVFYCPLLPLISAARLLMLFYVKKFTLVRCCVPAQRMFRTASSSVLFLFMLLLGLFMSVATLGISISRFVPGGCGPFQGTGTVVRVSGACLQTLPVPVQTGVAFMWSEAFAFALLLAEVVVLTSYVSRGRANRKAMERLKDMLVMCSSDKRFLVKQHSTLSRRPLRRH